MPKKKKTNMTLSGFLFFAVVLLVVAMMTCRDEAPTFNPVEQTPIEVIEEKAEEVEVKLDSIKQETIDRLKEALPELNIDSLVKEKEESVLMIEQEEVVVPAEVPAVEEPAVKEAPVDTTKTEETIQETQEGVKTDGQ